MALQAFRLERQEDKQSGEQCSRDQNVTFTMV